MSEAPKPTPEDFAVAVLAVRARGSRLVKQQVALTALCWILIALAVGARLLGYPSLVTIPIALLGAACGIGSWFVGRLAKPLLDKSAEFSNAIKQAKSVHAARAADIDQISAEKAKIPLTIGFANLSGDDLEDMAAHDAGTLSTLFARSGLAPHDQIPAAEVLFVYARLNQDGTIGGQSRLNVRQIAQVAKARILVLASPNAEESIKRAVALPGEKSANIVFTTDRNGGAFARFFSDLFEAMHSGKDMLSAWVELSPQHAATGASPAPETILIAEAGKLAFPR